VPDQALLPVWFNRRSGRYNPGNTFTVGGLADSYFESLLKMWLLQGKRVRAAQLLWLKFGCMRCCLSLSPSKPPARTLQHPRQQHMFLVKDACSLVEREAQEKPTPCGEEANALLSSRINTPAGRGVQEHVGACNG
jgi:hypothetical protein